MLTPKPQLNLRNAKGYFREHLAVGDYYTAGHVVPGEWCGVAASMLGLEGAVTEEAFLKLCDGLNPKTGNRLTARRNTNRVEGGSTVSNRRVFYDFTISPPKSVSVVALYQDSRIIEVHDAAARVMMNELEKFARTRVRKNGAFGDRVTGSVLGALFRHDTSRELDPHLHTHCILFNATYDKVEDRWKALEAADMYRAQKFAENLYYHELSKGLRKLGYEIENHSKSFEIKGVPVEVISKFSKRHHQIDADTQKRIEAEGLKGNINDLREQVAHDNRRRKIKNTPTELLRPQWKEQMNRAERKALDRLQPGMLARLFSASPPPGKKEGIPDYLAWAEKHIFERNATAYDHELMALALAQGRGEDFSLPALEQAVLERDYVRDARNKRLLTSREMLAAEWALVTAATDGRKQHPALHEHYQPSATLNEEQRQAVTHILTSRDFMTLFEGGAGTGKSFALQDLMCGLKESGHTVVVTTAPQRQQADALHEGGLEGATTLASLLTPRSRLPRGAVVLLDEAGQVGARDMLKLVEKVRSCQGRLILSGDIRQHGAVAASDALRAIRRYSELEPARLKTIFRQDPSRMKTRKEKRFVKQYRDAVQAASEGRTVDSFDKLDKMGCIRELDTAERLDTLAREYCAALDRKEKVLAVAQTRVEVAEANAAIRERLQTERKLEKGKSMKTLQSLDLTEAQKQDARFYELGSKVVFVTKYGRFNPGDSCEVAGFKEHGVTLVKNGKASTVSFEHASRFIVAAAKQIDVAPGERLQMKFNGQSADHKPVRNGELVTVEKVFKNGRIRIKDDNGTRKTLSAQQRLFVHGYALTSYGSQGKTVDTVLASYADNQVPASQNQWYVAISRARKNVLVLTEDKLALRTHIEQESNRPLALSLLSDTGASLAEQIALIDRARRHCQKVQREEQARRPVHSSPALRRFILPPSIIQQHNRGIRL